MSRLNLSKDLAKKLWIRTQRLDERTPFGEGPLAVQRAIEHLGYVQIDAIHVIERCHHHILYSRIPNYRRSDLWQLQTKDKTIFEYWTHALSYVPSQDYRYFIPQMKRTQLDPGPWFKKVKPEEFRRVLRLIKNEDPLSIRDIEDETLVEKDHEWASRKPSKRALQLGFYTGHLVVSERQGIGKKYELRDRHFGWKKPPRSATPKEIAGYLLDRALRSQGLVSLDSICHLRPQQKPEVLKEILKRVQAKSLVPVQIEGVEKILHWMTPRIHDESHFHSQDLVHLLSPFDPLIIQRKRLKIFFDYEHVFEAYLPKEKRIYGYFTLPILMDGEVVSRIDLKTDREKRKLKIQKWTWLPKKKSVERKQRVESELGRFEKFQLADSRVETDWT